MTAKEWLDIMKQATDYNPEFTILIEKYGEMKANEFKNWCNENETNINFQDEHNHTTEELYKIHLKKR